MSKKDFFTLLKMTAKFHPEKSERSSWINTKNIYNKKPAEITFQKSRHFLKIRHKFGQINPPMIKY